MEENVSIDESKTYMTLIQLNKDLWLRVPWCITAEHEQKLRNTHIITLNDCTIKKPCTDNEKSLNINDPDTPSTSNHALPHQVLESTCPSKSIGTASETKRSTGRIVLRKTPTYLKSTYKRLITNSPDHQIEEDPSIHCISENVKITINGSNRRVTLLPSNKFSERSSCSETLPKRKSIVRFKPMDLSTTQRQEVKNSSELCSSEHTPEVQHENDEQFENMIENPTSSVSEDVLPNSSRRRVYHSHTNYYRSKQYRRYNPVSKY